VDSRSLAAAYDRSAEGYDERFRALQREKYRAAAPVLAGMRFDGGPALDAGSGTALFAEWLADDAEPHSDVRRALARFRWVALDLSTGMLRRGRGRSALPVVADLARPALRDGSCALAVAFTSVLEEKPRALAALGRCLRPGAFLIATFLKAECPSAVDLERWSGLRVQSGPLEAGQDLLFSLRRSA
jgi:ubiquinone/menaquinone biosynthesis C-methylase UbiE